MSKPHARNIPIVRSIIPLSQPLLQSGPLQILIDLGLRNDTETVMRVQCHESPTIISSIPLHSVVTTEYEENWIQEAKQSLKYLSALTKKKCSFSRISEKQS